MKAVSCQAGRLEVADLPAPTPAKGPVAGAGHQEAYRIARDSSDAR